MSSSNWLLGSDPEAFLLRKSDNKILSAIGKLGGTKDKPMPVEELGRGFAFQEDNVLVEFNIPPARSLSAWQDHHMCMMRFLERKVDAEHGCRLEYKASHVMDDSELEDERAHVFGCEPDFNVWTLANNPRPRCENPALRSAGGHIHIGLKMGKMDKIALARLLDWHLGLWSVIEDPDTQRRQLYGKAGAIRFKPYGLEYRTLSNFWLKSAALMQAVYLQVDRAIAQWEKGDFSQIEKYGSKIFETINSSNVDEAKTLLRW